MGVSTVCSKSARRRLINTTRHEARTNSAVHDLFATRVLFFKNMEHLTRTSAYRHVHNLPRTEDARRYQSALTTDFELGWRRQGHLLTGITSDKFSRRSRCVEGSYLCLVCALQIPFVCKHCCIEPCNQLHMYMGRLPCCPCFFLSVTRNIYAPAVAERTCARAHQQIHPAYSRLLYERN